MIFLKESGIIIGYSHELFNSYWRQDANAKTESS